MAASYPRSVPTFPTHRNLLDDVDAEHINSIQSELVSISGTVGTYPHKYEESLTVGPAPPSNSVGGIGVVHPPQNAQSTVKTTDHGTVTKRLESLQKMSQVHCFRLYLGSPLDLAPTSAAPDSGVVRYIKFPSPSSSEDPFKLYNGTGVILQKSGFYLFNGFVMFAMLGSGTSTDKNNGSYVAGITKNYSWTEGSDISKKDTNPDPGSVRLRPHLSGFFTAGQVVSLRVAQSSSITQRIDTASLTGFLVREA